MFTTVDLVEQNEDYTNFVRQYVGYASKLGTVYNRGLQAFEPRPKYYDVIWCQWVLGHLTNNDFVEFLKRCGQALNKNGILVIKENVTSNDRLDIDHVDSSVTRPLGMLKLLLASSDLRIIKMVKQTSFPKVIFPVYMIACKPVKKAN